jgi:hypothetical protein
LKDEDYFKDPDIDEKIILKWVLEGCHGKA